MSYLKDKIALKLRYLQHRIFLGRLDREAKESIDREYYRQQNAPYEQEELSQKTRAGMPSIKTTEETLARILQDRASLARFGDGEFKLMEGEEIGFQKKSTALARRLSGVLASREKNLLVGLPETFGSLQQYTPKTADFWRRWMVKKRKKACQMLDMTREYHSAFLTRIYMPRHKTAENYEHCHRFFDAIKQLWANRDVVICEGEGTRFGALNDLLDGSRSVTRILCPAKNAFDHYDEILSAFESINRDTLVLAALGPTATVLAYDLSHKGFQTIDIGHLDVEYEWFLQRATTEQPIQYKYVDRVDGGTTIQKLDDEKYQSQILRRIA